MAARRRTTESGRAPRIKNGRGKAGTRAPAKKLIKSGPLPLIIAIVAVLAATGVGVYFGIAPYYTDTITDGVVIDGMDLSGMTYEEAFGQLSSYAAERLGGMSVTVNYEGRTWICGANELNATLDVSAALNGAASVARTGKLSQRKTETKAALAGEYSFETKLNFDTDNLEHYLNQIKQELDSQPVEPTMALQCEGPVYTVPGYSSYQSGLDYSSLFVVTPGISGVEVDVDTTMSLLVEALAENDTASVGLVVFTEQPVTSGQALRDSAVLLYHSSSKLSGSPDNRDTNIRLALSNFDGMVIAPGQVVSFNQTVGERTEERGYLKAKQIGPNGTLVNELGGGICQAATTLFNAAINAGCEIIERNPHKWPLYYDDYGWGLDAMVDWGTSDLQFKNTTGGYLYMDFYFDYAQDKPAHVNIDIYGLPFEPGVTVEMKSEKVRQYPAPGSRYEHKNNEEARTIGIPADDWKYDKNLNKMTYVKVASRPGYVFRVYRVWYKDGQETSREELYTTDYPALQGIIYTKAP